METRQLTDWMLDEHDRVNALADRLRQKIATLPRGNPIQWIADLRAGFDEFATHAREHFRLEEEGGYLSQVIEMRPALAEAVAIIRHQHEELTQLFADVETAVHELKPTDVLLLRDCCRRIGHLLTWIERHEEHENHIVLYAFTQDLGAQD